MAQNAHLRECSAFRDEAQAAAALLGHVNLLLKVNIMRLGLFNNCVPSAAAFWNSL